MSSVWGHLGFLPIIPSIVYIVTFRQSFSKPLWLPCIPGSVNTLQQDTTEQRGDQNPASGVRNTQFSRYAVTQVHFFFVIFIGIELSYNVILVFTVQQTESTIYIYIYMYPLLFLFLFFHISHRRALSRYNAIQQCQVVRIGKRSPK